MKINFVFCYYVHYYPNSPLSEIIPKDILDFLCTLRKLKIYIVTNEELNTYIPDQGYFGEQSKHVTRVVALNIFGLFDKETISQAKLVCKSWHKIISDHSSFHNFKNDEISEKQIEELDIDFNKKLTI